MFVARFSRSTLTAAGIGLMAVATAAYAGAPLGWEAHPPHHVKNNATRAPSGLNPTQVRNAYGVPASSTANRQTIAIVDAYDDPNALSDLNYFSAQFGLPQFNTTGGPTFTKVTTGGKVRANGNWALEISLDIQWAHAVYPDANILLVEAASNSMSNLMSGVDTAVSRGAKVVSCSWGGSEFSSESSYDSHFNKAGVTFTVSSGDNGAGVEYPTASPYVVSVGGTTLHTDASGNYGGESGWNGSGGGTSAYESKPAFQSSLSFSMRSIPDVALDADPNTGVSVYDSYGYNGQKGWFTVGGTSASAPMWGAMIALANSQRTSSLTGATTLYNIYQSKGYTDYHDITSGSNGLPAGPDYDQVTGIGSSVANLLIPDLAAAK